MPEPNASGSELAGEKRGVSRWLRGVLLLLVAEKIIQHVAVTVAFVFDIGHLRSSVALDYRLFLVSGAISAILFALAGWGLLTHRPWAKALTVGLALVDIGGEFLAQGTLLITLNVSVLVATVLLILALVYRDRSK